MFRIDILKKKILLDKEKQVFITPDGILALLEQDIEFIDVFKTRVYCFMTP